MSGPFYFDYAATSIPDAEIAHSALEESLAYFANPSSPHHLGKAAQQRLQHWRARAAKALNVQKEQIIFTGGATEANQMILLRLLLNKDPGNTHIVASGFEHASVHESLLTLKHAGCKLSWVNPGNDGCICPKDFLAQITPKTRLVTLMMVNNETGAIQPTAQVIQDIRSLAHGHHIHVHIDAVQAIGRIHLNLHDLDCDSLCLSAHKIGGPKGIGLLYLKKPVPTLLKGGGQENDMRAGTENLFGICGCVLALEKIQQRHSQSRSHEQLWLSRLKDMGATFLPADRAIHPENFTQGIIAFAFPPLPGEVLMRLLSDRHVYVGTGSACGQNKKDRLRALTCIGIADKIAQCAVRVSFHEDTPLEHSIQALDILEEIIADQRKVLNF